MTTLNQWLSDAVRKLEQAGTGAERLDAELILGHVLGHGRPWLHTHSETVLTAQQARDASSLVTRRTAREPLVHLTGSREFYGLKLEITPDVLTPRVETEQMVDWAVKYAPRGSRLIDIGTGSGAIAIAIATHRPDLHVTATDLSDRELTVARRNAQNHHAQIEFIESNLWSHVPGIFNTVVTNLPYLRDDADLMPEVRREPAVALFGGEDGLDLYRRFLKGLPEHLAPDGRLFTECDPWQHEALIAAAARCGLTPIEQGYFILGFQRSGQPNIDSTPEAYNTPKT